MISGSRSTSSEHPDVPHALRPTPRQHSAWRWGLALLATAAVMLALDLTFLGVVASDFYTAQLGSLRAQPVNLLPALLFYVFYLLVTLSYAVAPAHGVRQALARGAALGGVSYSVYELTNWAVIRDWPAALVPVDILWGVVLTALAAGAGRLALEGRGGRCETPPG